MSRSSAAQASAVSNDAVDEGVLSPPTSLPPLAESAGLVPLRAPNFGAMAEAYTSRMAGRINASSASEKEHEELLRERQTLLDKKLNNTITKRELNRLEYVRWSLDRIEDAKHGYLLDALESAVVRYENFLAEIGRLQEQLLAATKTRK